MAVLPLSEVKARLSEIADEVNRTHRRVHITKNGKDYVVLLAAEDLESIEATLELLSDPAAQARITQSGDEIVRGEGLSIAEVARSLEERFGKLGRDLRSRWSW
jgi:prevent-host-death family protein